jgi:hypothetical protein
MNNEGYKIFSVQVSLSNIFIIILFINIISKNHGYEPQGKPVDLNSAAEQRGIIPSDFVGIVRLTNFLSLHSKNLSLTNKNRF